MAKKNTEIQEKILDVDASMQGTITFKDPVNLRINGSFEGKLDTRAIAGSATIRGNIRTPRLSIAEGAILEGQINMVGLGSSEGSDVSLTLKDVAQYLEVESKVIEEWAHSRKIPARYENGMWIFSKSEVDQWIQQEKARV